MLRWIHSSDICSIRFKHTRIIRFFGLFKKIAQNTQSGKGYAKNHCDRSRGGRTRSLIAAPRLGKADFCFKGLRVKPAGTQT